MRAKSATILFLSLSMTGLLLVGCEDESAKQRRQLQESVTTATATLRDATLVVVDPNNTEQFEKAREQLKRVVRDLRSVDITGDTGQELSINLLLADAGQKLASMYLAEMEHAGSAMRDDSALARAHLSSIQRLSGFVQAAGSLDVTAETTELESERSTAAAQLNQISTMLAQLDGPIEQITSENRNDSQRINDLRREAEELVQRAGELGPADGFPQYEQAVEIQREAGVIETQIAHRELDLAYQYEPQQATADTQAQRLQQYIDALNQAEQKLDEIINSISTEVSKTNQQASALRSELEDRLAAIEATITGPIETAWQQGIDAAEQALRASRSATRAADRSNKDSAKLLESQLLETKGRLHWAKARALAEQINVLERVVAAADAVGDVSDAQQTLKLATITFDEAITAARDAYTEAQVALPGGNIKGMDALRRSLDLAIGAISGQSVQDMRDSMPADHDDQSMHSPDDGSGAGFQSPEALLAALKTIDPLKPETSRVMIEAVHTTSPLQNQAVDAMNDLNDVGVRLMTAITDKLGSQVANSLNQMGSATTPDFTSATFIDQNDEAVTVQFDSLSPMAGGQKLSLDFIRIADQWKISFDSMMRLNSIPGLSTSDSVTMFRAMTHVMDDIAERIETGDITSEQQLMTAVQAGMISALGGQ